MRYFDLHCDTLYECYETGKNLRENDLMIDRAKVSRYNHYAQFFALFCGAHAPDGVKRARSLFDLQFSEIVRRGGLCGINLYSAFLREDGTRGTLSDVLRHIEHFMEQGGESCLALGCDFDGCDSLPAEIATARCV